MTRLDPLWLRVYRDVGADRYLTRGTARRSRGGHTHDLGNLRSPVRPLHRRRPRSALPPLRASARTASRGARVSARRAHGDRRRRPVTRQQRRRSAAHPRSRARRVVVARRAGAAVARTARRPRARRTAERVRRAGRSRRSPLQRIGAPASVHQGARAAAAPPDLLKDLDADACRLAEGLPTWGLWPATLTALALERASRRSAWCSNRRSLRCWRCSNCWRRRRRARAASA